MQPLKLKGRYTVDNVNARKEAHGDEKILAVDVKLSGDASIAELVPLLGIESADKAMGTLWGKADPHDVTLANIDSVKIPSETKFEELTGKVGSVTFYEATAKKLSFVPGAGGGTLTLTLAIPHPEQAKVGSLAEMIGETHQVSVEPMQQGLDGV